MTVSNGWHRAQMRRAVASRGSGPLLATIFLYVFGIMAIAGAVLTITSRNPVYSALWFASVVLSTAGLFLLADAPFLAALGVTVGAGSAG